MKRTCAVLLLLTLAALLHAQTSSEHIRLEKERNLPGEEIEIHFSGMPGANQDWIALVPATAAENTHGQWFYTRGRTSGTHTFRGVRVGTYEIRVYYDWPRGGYEVRDRLRFSVVDVDESAGAFAPAAETPGEWRGPETRSVPGAAAWRARGAQPAAAERILERLHTMVDLIRATDAIGRPVGFESRSTVSVELGVPQWMRHLPSPTPGPALSWARVSLYPYYQSRDGSVFTEASFGSIAITENDPSPLSVWGGGCRTLDDEWWFLEPRAVGTAGRFTIYEMVGDPRTGQSGNRRAVILTSLDLPEPWLPVTMQEFLEDRVRRMELRLAEARAGLERVQALGSAHEQTLRIMRESYEAMKDENPSTAKELYETIIAFEEAWLESDEENWHGRMVEAAEQLHAEMEQQIAEVRGVMDRATAAELRAQAHGSANYGLPAEPYQVTITPPGVPGGSEVRGIVRPNPAVLSLGYAPDSVRMLTVALHATGWPVLSEAIARFIDEFDWEALAALLD